MRGQDLGVSRALQLVALLTLAVCGLASVQRFGHSVVQLPEGDAVIFGGHSFKGVNYETREYEGLKNDIWRFHFNNNSWVEIRPASAERPEPRMEHTAVYRDGDMVIFGGTTYNRFEYYSSTIYRGCGRNDVWAFNFDNSTWRQLHAQTGHCSAAPLPAAGLALAALALALFR